MMALATRCRTATSPTRPAPGRPAPRSPRRAGRTLRCRSSARCRRPSPRCAHRRPRGPPLPCAAVTDDAVTVPAVMLMERSLDLNNAFAKCMHTSAIIRLWIWSCATCAAWSRDRRHGDVHRCRHRAGHLAPECAGPRRRIFSACCTAPAVTSAPQQPGMHVLAQAQAADNLIAESRQRGWSAMGRHTRGLAQRRWAAGHRDVCAWSPTAHSPPSPRASATSRSFGRLWTTPRLRQRRGRPRAVRDVQAWARRRCEVSEQHAHRLPGRDDHPTVARRPDARPTVQDSTREARLALGHHRRHGRGLDPGGDHEPVPPRRRRLPSVRDAPPITVTMIWRITTTTIPRPKTGGASSRRLYAAPSRIPAEGAGAGSGGAARSTPRA